MQEDILGTQASLSRHTRYVICSRCNKPVERSAVTITSADMLGEVRSEYEYLCPDCQQDLAQGEKILPPTAF